MWTCPTAYTWEVIDQSGNVIDTYNSHQSSFQLTNTSNIVDSIYTIRLIVGDTTTGCDSILTSDTITVFHNPLADFNQNHTALCAPNTIQVIDSSTAGTGLVYQWTTNPPTTTITNQNGDTTDIIFPDNQSGTSNFYDINLLVTTTDLCTHNTTYQVELYTRPDANFSITDTGCGEVTYTTVNNT